MSALHAHPSDHPAARLLVLPLVLALAACGGGNGADGAATDARASIAAASSASATLARLTLAGVPVEKAQRWTKVGTAEKALARATFSDLPRDEVGAAAMLASSADLTDSAVTVTATTGRAGIAAAPVRSWRPPTDTGSGIDYPIERYRSWVVRAHTVVTDPAGNTISAWLVDSGFGNATYKALHRAAGSSVWVNADLPMGPEDPDGFEALSDLQIVHVAGGDAVALWAWRNGSRGELRSAWYNAASGSWSGPYRVPGDRFDGVSLDSPPRLVSDGQGGALLVGIGGPASDDTGWQQLGLWVAHFDTAAKAWKTPVNLRLLTPAYSWEGTPSVVTNSDGKLLVAYTTRCLADGRTATWIQLYNPLTGASRWPNLLSVDQLRASAPQVLPLSYGRAVVAWSGSETETGAWWRMVGPDSWPVTAAARVPGAPASVIGTSARQNDAFLFYGDGARPLAQWKVQRFDARNLRWDAAVAAFTQTPDDSSPPQFAADGAGNLTLAWDGGDASGNARELRTRRWTAASASWSAPSLPGVHAIETGSAGYSASYPRLAAQADGRTTLLWTNTTAYYGNTAPFVSSYVVHLWSADWQ
ncbi:hypothetical protein [Derxia lacustris]|uniref:hypothetical protein n=1 Tax=Derxia lacustris TaxID=764842 RepID=UPI000A16EFD7|nr:hypothetical protein [Derxia lacustris]